MSELVFSPQLDVNITIVPRFFTHFILISKIRLWPLTPKSQLLQAAESPRLKETSTLTCAAI